MNTARDDGLRARVDACLDERRDPLDDPDLAAWLADEPDRLLAFVEQRAMLRELGARPTAAPARRGPRWRLATAAAAAAFALWLGAEGWRAAGEDASTPPGAPAPSRIVAVRIELRSPTFGVTAPVTARELLASSPDLTLEAWSTETRMR